MGTNFEEEVTKVKLKGVNVEDFLNDDLVEGLKKKGLKIKPAVIAIMLEKEIELKGKKKKINIPIVMEHNSDEELKNKLLKISCDDSEAFKKVREVIKELIENE